LEYKKEQQRYVNSSAAFGVSFGYSDVRSDGSSLSRSVEFRVECVKVLGIQIILNDPERFAESLEVDDFARTQEFDRFSYIGIVNETKNIIINGSRFLLCCTFKKTTT
jgi:hypothetical protein